MDRLSPFIAAAGGRNMPVSVADPAQPDCPLVYVNPAFEHLTGYASADILGKNCRFLQGAETWDGSVQQIRDAIAAVEPVSTCLLNYRRDGAPFHNLLFMEPISFDDGSHLLMGCQHEIDSKSYSVHAHVDNLSVLRNDLQQSWRRAMVMRDDALAMRAEVISGLVKTYVQSLKARPL
ncbi:MAG: PAS domain-containing protein [Pseudomonadota bacterium]